MTKYTSICKRLLMIALATILLIGMVGCSGSNDSAGKSEPDNGMGSAQSFYDKVSECQELMDDVADTIYSNWYDAIYNDKFREDINYAIACALETHEEDINKIKTLDGEIADLFKTAKNSPCAEQVKDVMSAYSDYYEFVINVSGSFKSYSADKESLKKELASALKDLSFDL